MSTAKVTLPEIVTKWVNAQIHERNAHHEPESIGWDHYRQSYRQYFKYTGVPFRLKGESIMEIGPADYPALAYVAGYGPSIVIEPMPSAILAEFGKSGNILLVKEPAETHEFPQVDEVWLFNVLQHTIDPGVIVKKAKEAANVVRFFEPINVPTDVMHLHTFTLQTFYDWFGQENVSHYPTCPGAVNFHTHECAFGVWKKDT